MSAFDLRELAREHLFDVLTCERKNAKPWGEIRTSWFLFRVFWPEPLWQQPAAVWDLAVAASWLATQGAHLAQVLPPGLDSPETLRATVRERCATRDTWMETAPEVLFDDRSHATLIWRAHQERYPMCASAVRYAQARHRLLARVKEEATQWARLCEGAFAHPAVEAWLRAARGPDEPERQGAWRAQLWGRVASIR